ncbi:unnamed protein product [Adineta ricciae]|uniref:Uncharacterized protein n=1 Tax=Adineta ricciae TaxID=249248 RepID=A0A815KYV0_ADIRI|nr:unnamed protein product [Adineta ricciae]CAF1592691.1 unnamed protein product [Adineta ricciae]
MIPNDFFSFDPTCIPTGTNEFVVKSYTKYNDSESPSDANSIPSIHSTSIKLPRPINPALESNIGFYRNRNMNFPDFLRVIIDNNSNESTEIFIGSCDFISTSSVLLDSQDPNSDADLSPSIGNFDAATLSLASDDEDADFCRDRDDEEAGRGNDLSSNV